MKLNIVEKWAMNNPLRAWIQRWLEVPYLVGLASPPGGRTLEVGCGRGEGIRLARRHMGAGEIDAFDLDPDMVRRARVRTAGLEGVRLWEGSVTDIPADDGTYDMVLDFGILHHVTDWRAGLAEISRVLRPGGRLYAEEPLIHFVDHWSTRALLVHPSAQLGLFDSATFRTALEEVGLVLVGQKSWGPWFAWYAADKPAEGHHALAGGAGVRPRVGLRQDDSSSVGPPERFPATGWLAIVAAYLLVPLVLIAGGNDPGWWQAWALSLVVLVAGVGGRMWAERSHPGLQADRMRFGRGQRVKPWDRALAPLMGLSTLYLPVIVGALDHRCGSTASFQTSASVVGLLLCALGYGVGAWALAENRFFTSVVRIQTERDHQVCDSGPYRFVRHPGYAGILLGLVGIPLALDSGWAFVASGLALAISVLRTALEDRTLAAELPGYREYARRVRYRLFPGLW